MQRYSIKDVKYVAKTQFLWLLILTEFIYSKYEMSTTSDCKGLGMIKIGFRTSTQFFTMFSNSQFWRESSCNETVSVWWEGWRDKWDYRDEDNSQEEYW